jgi:diadenosine tetraphosphate (Ap4A) HIT family hydrolase
MDDCLFCAGIRGKHLELFFEDESGLFVGWWDDNPARPGHALLIPKRHIQYFREMNEAEMCAVAIAVATIKSEILLTDLSEVYNNKLHYVENEKSLQFIHRAQALLEEVGGRPPDAFNDGINDGVAGGQTIPHMHWHVIPRWDGDDPDPRGGVRHMFKGLGNYHKGIQG